MSSQSPVLRQNGAKSLPFALNVFILIAFLACAFQARAQVTYTGAANSLVSLPGGSTISPLAVDSNGDAFFVASSGASHALYEITAGGTTTVLNSSFPYSPSALAVSPSGDRLFFIYQSSTPQGCLNAPPYSFGINDYVYLASVATTSGASPSNMTECFFLSYNAFYSDPTGLAMDSSGNLYVADFGGGVIWKLNAPVSASSVPSSFFDMNQQPYDIAIHGNTIYFTALNFNNSSANTLYSVSASNFSSSLPTGPASTSALVVVPSIQDGLAVDSNGNVYLGTGSGVDEYSGGVLSTLGVALGGGATGVAVDSSNNLYFAGTDGSGNPVVAQQSSQSVNFHSVNVGSTSSTVSLGFTIGASTSTTIGSVHIYTQGASGLDFADAGSSTCTAKTYASSTNCVINVKFTPRNAGLRSGAVVLSDGSGNTLRTVYIYGTGVGPQVAFGPGTQSTIKSGLNVPAGIAVDASGNVYIADGANNRVVKEPWTGSSYGTQSTIGTSLSTPRGVAVDGSGNVYIGDGTGLIKVPWTGSGYGTQTTIGSGLTEPSGVAVDGAGNVYVADSTLNTVVKEPWTGSGYSTQTTVIGSGLNQPFGVAVDGSGNVYVADTSNNRVVKAAWTGSGYGTPTSIGSGLSLPDGVAVDGGGNVYIADSANNRVVRAPWTGSSYGTQTTLGSGWNTPGGVAVDGGSNVYVTDQGTATAVKVDLADAPSLSFATTPVGVESSDSPKSVTIFNVGNAALTLPIPTSGNNPAISSGFASDAATTCPELTTSSSAGSLGRGASCVYAVDFIPVASGAASGSLVMKDNNLNAAGPGYTTQSISLSGTGQQVTLSPSSLTAGTVGTVYTQTISASGGTAPYTFAVTAGSLPAGLSLSSAGVLSGTPTAGGTFNLTVTTTDSASKTGTQAYTLTVNAPTIALVPMSMPGATAGLAFSQTVTGSGGTAPFTYVVSAGALPAGLTLTSSGVLSGTATTTGTFNFTIKVTDSSTGTGPYSGTRAYTLTVSAPTITVSPATLTNATDGVSYSGSVSATGGTAPFTYAVTAGVLPAGLTLGSSGVLSGTPTAGGSFSFTITATDSSTGSGPYTGSRAYTLTAGAPTITVSPATVPNPTDGISFSQSLTAAGGTGAFTYAVTAGALPAGTSLSSSGVFSGTPTAAGSFNFTITATDHSTGAGPYSGSRAFALTVNAPTVTVSPATLPGGTYNSAYSQSLSTSGGTSPYSYSVTSGALPSGLTLSSVGVLSGTPTAAGSFTFTAAATDSSTGTGPFTGSQIYTILINKASQTITFTAPASPVTYGISPITLSASATSGQAVSFSVVSGPATVSGNTLTITGAGTVVVAADQAGNSNYTAATQATATIVVNKASQTISFTPPASPVAYGVPAIALSATSTSGLSVSFSLVSGPATVSGNTLTITGAGTVVVAADQAGNSNYTAATQATATIVVNKASQTISFTPPASPVTYGVSPITLSATANSGLPVSFSLVSGPATLSGNTLTITGAGTVVVAANQAGNANYQPASQATGSIVVNQASQTITFTPPVSPVAYGVSAIALSATSNSGLPVSFTVLSGPATISGNSLSVTGVGTIVIAANQAGNTNYTAAPQVTESIAVNQTALKVTANNASRVYGTANPAFTGAVSGSVNGDSFTESFSTSAGITANAGTYAIVPAVTGANLANYSVSVQDGTLTITQAGTLTSLGISSASITPGQSVTLTAQVASLTTGSPTGGVSFYDGGTLLGTSPLAGGSAAFATSSLTAGTTHTLTAIYNGDVNFTSSSTTASTSVVVAALDFTFTLSGPANQTVVPGSSVNFLVTVDPLYGSYAGPISFTTTGLPPGATVSFSPTTIATNAGQQTVTLSIQTAGVTAMHAPPSIARRLAPFSLALLLLPLAGTRRMRKQSRRLNRFLVLIFLIGGMAATATLTGCGSKNGFFTQAQKNYDITITAAAGNITHTVNVTIQVQ